MIIFFNVLTIILRKFKENVFISGVTVKSLIDYIFTSLPLSIFHLWYSVTEGTLKGLSGIPHWQIHWNFGNKSRWQSFDTLHVSEPTHKVFFSTCFSLISFSISLLRLFQVSKPSTLSPWFREIFSLFFSLTLNCDFIVRVQFLEIAVHMIQVQGQLLTWLQ